MIAAVLVDIDVDAGVKVGVNVGVDVGGKSMFVCDVEDQIWVGIWVKLID